MTLVQRPTAPPLVSAPTETMYGAVQANTDPKWSCRCADPDVHRLVELINSGMEQVEASKLLWGPPHVAPTRVPSGVARGLFGVGLRGRC